MQDLKPYNSQGGKKKKTIDGKLLDVGLSNEFLDLTPKPKVEKAK